MFGFIKICFFIAIAFSRNVLNTNSFECVSMNNQKCKIRSELINVNTNEPVFYPYKKAVLILLMIHMLNYMFLMLLKT